MPRCGRRKSCRLRTVAKDMRSLKATQGNPANYLFIMRCAITQKSGNLYVACQVALMLIGEKAEDAAVGCLQCRALRCIELASLTEPNPDLMDPSLRINWEARAKPTKLSEGACRRWSKRLRSQDLRRSRSYHSAAGTQQRCWQRSLPAEMKRKAEMGILWLWVKTNRIPFWGRCTTILEPVLVGIGMFTGGMGF